MLRLFLVAVGLILAVPATAYDIAAWPTVGGTGVSGTDLTLSGTLIADEVIARPVPSPCFTLIDSGVSGTDADGTTATDVDAAVCADGTGTARGDGTGSGSATLGVRNGNTNPTNSISGGVHVYINSEDRIGSYIPEPIISGSADGSTGLVFPENTTDTDTHVMAANSIKIRNIDERMGLVTSGGEVTYALAPDRQTWTLDGALATDPGCLGVGPGIQAVACSSNTIDGTTISFMEGPVYVGAIQCTTGNITGVDADDSAALVLAVHVDQYPGTSTPDAEVAVLTINNSLAAETVRSPIEHNTAYGAAGEDVHFQMQTVNQANLEGSEDVVLFCTVDFYGMPDLP